MVDVGAKPETARRAAATARVRLSESVFELVRKVADAVAGEIKSALGS